MVKRKHNELATPTVNSNPKKGGSGRVPDSLKEEKRPTKRVRSTTKDEEHDKKRSVLKTKPEITKQEINKREVIKRPRRDSSVVDEESDVIVIVDDGDDQYPSKVKPQPPHEKTPKHRRHQRDEKKVVKKKKNLEEAEAEAEGVEEDESGEERTTREQNEETLGEDDPHFYAEFAQRMNRAMVERHDLDFADICSIDAEFKDVVEAIKVRRRHRCDSCSHCCSIWLWMRGLSLTFANRRPTCMTSQRLTLTIFGPWPPNC
jgi:hypothetical protein